MQRHSDHHAHPGRRYQTLHASTKHRNPRMATHQMLLLSMTPFWLRVMGPRVVAYYNGDVTRANIAPQRRDK